MESKIIVLAIIATSLATFISRFMGAITSEKVSVKSKIFSWFKSDFGNKIQLLKFVNKYSRIKILENATIEYLNYDWSLNEKSLK